ncbi:MAG: hypothetical protein ACK5CE_16950 [Actinomycetes bacterium]|nr:hypothetical protein [Actinomycetota bacterium]
MVASAGPQADGGIVVEVAGGALPRDVVAAYESSGGELAVTASWDARFETFGLPRIAGDGVALVSARAEAVAVAGGWQRSDELQWLLRDDAMAGLDGLLDRVAVAAGVDDWTRTDEVSEVQGARCTTRIYTASDVPSPTWRVYGCSYPNELGMYAVAVAREGAFTTEEPVIAEPSAVAVASTVGGHLQEVSVVFARPASVGSLTTLTTRVVIGFERAPVDAVADSLQRDALEGWRAMPGDNSVLFSGAPGQSWVLGDGSVVFSGEGRLEP